MRLLISTICTIFLTAAISQVVAAPKPDNQTLETFHGKMWPKSENGYVTKQQCMACHGSYDKLAAQTASLQPNPHYSHLGEVNCEDCHKGNTTKPQLMCNSCHNFTITKKTDSK